jgi:hypothetical protein
VVNDDLRRSISSLFAECVGALEAGQKEYARDVTNPFANFERVGRALGLPREKVLLVYLLKHIDGITAWANGHNSQREPVRGRIVDAIVYLALLAAMDEGIDK